MILGLFVVVCCNPIEENLFVVVCANKPWWEKVVEQSVAKKGMGSSPIDKGTSRSSLLKTCKGRSHN